MDIRELHDEIIQKMLLFAILNGRFNVTKVRYSPQMRGYLMDYRDPVTGEKCERGLFVEDRPMEQMVRQGAEALRRKLRKRGVAI